MGLVDKGWGVVGSLQGLGRGLALTVRGRLLLWPLKTD